MESFAVKLTWLGCKHLNFVLPSLLFTIPTGAVQTDAPATGAANIGGLTLLMPIPERRNTNAGKQI